MGRLNLIPKTHLIEDIKKTRVFYRGYVDDYTNAPTIIRYTHPKLRKWRREALKDATMLRESIIKQQTL